MPTIKIESEDQAWELLERATNGEKFADDVELIFSGWPTLTYDFKGRDWNSTVPTRVMTPLLQAQKDLNRAFARVKYGEGNLHRLKESERDDLELVVKVEQGSSVFNVELWKQINQIVSSVSMNMSGTQEVITILGIALAIVSPIMFKAWISGRLKQRQHDATMALSQEETKRFQIFADAMKKEPVVQATNDDARATQNRMLKAVKPDDSVQISNVGLSGTVAAVVAQPDDEYAKDVFLEGDFRVLANHTDKSAGFRIRCERISDGLVIWADVPVELRADQKALIEKAEWSKGIVHLHMTASLLRGTYSNGVVSSAGPARPPTQ